MYTYTEAPISINGTTNTISTGKRNRKKDCLVQDCIHTGIAVGHV